MNKPTKPIKPKVTDPQPTKTITVSKLLLKNNCGRFVLRDQKTNPELFQPHDYEEYPDWNKLGELELDYNFETLSYFDYQQISSDCKIVGNFEVEQYRDNDNYYVCSYVNYETNNEDYQHQLNVYNNRFVVYEKELKDYEANLQKYHDFKKDQKRKKLEEELKSL